MTLRGETGAPFTVKVSFVGGTVAIVILFCLAPMLEQDAGRGALMSRGSLQVCVTWPIGAAWIAPVVTFRV